MNLDRMSDEVDAAFKYRDALSDIALQTGREKDYAAMLRQDAKAAHLLDLYNAAVERDNAATRSTR
jgi:hypothetical protein